MSKHNELRDKINQLCPELMKLEFGCEIKSYCHPSTDIVIDDESEIDSLVTGKYAIHERKNIKILGKDPTLEDVMRAIGKQYDSVNGWADYEIKTEEGYLSNISVKTFIAEGDYPLAYMDSEVMFTWELGKTASQQSIPTVEAILEILK